MKTELKMINYAVLSIVLTLILTGLFLMWKDSKDQ